MQVILVLLLAGGVLYAIRKSHAAEGEHLDPQTALAVDLALQNEHDPNVLIEFSKRLAGAGYAVAAKRVRDRAQELSA